MLGHSQTKERATGNPNLSLHHRATSRLYLYRETIDANAKVIAISKQKTDWGGKTYTETVAMRSGKKFFTRVKTAWWPDKDYWETR